MSSRYTYEVIGNTGFVACSACKALVLLSGADQHSAWHYQVDPKLGFPDPIGTVLEQIDSGVTPNPVLESPG